MAQFHSDEELLHFRLRKEARQSSSLVEKRLTSLQAKLDVWQNDVLRLIENVTAYFENTKRDIDMVMDAVQNVQALLRRLYALFYMMSITLLVSLLTWAMEKHGYTTAAFLPALMFSILAAYKIWSKL